MAFELAAFSELFTNYRERFIRFAETYVRDTAVAEDYVMDSFVYYWENRYNLGDNVNVPAYVLTIIKHKCLNYLQHQSLHKEIVNHIAFHAQWELNTRIASLESCEPYELFASEAQEIVKTTLERLPERTREIFIMSRMRNLSHKEIAEELHISTKGVEFHITKALKKLRAELKDYLPIFFYLFFV
mgnify:CR=1 FL=1